MRNTTPAAMECDDKIGHPRARAYQPAADAGEVAFASPLAGLAAEILCISPVSSPPFSFCPTGDASGFELYGADLKKTDDLASQATSLSHDQRHLNKVLITIYIKSGRSRDAKIQHDFLGGT